MSQFGTDVCPLHCSGLQALVRCPWRTTMHYLFEADGEGGVAGDTGSAMHRAAAAMHKGSNAAESLEVMHGMLHEYPRADLQDAAAMFLSYAADDRNRTAEFLLIEKQIAFSIAPAEDDPTGSPISVVGTLDQVRLMNGVPRLWDIKTSKKDPLLLLRRHQMQLAAYCVGATVLLGRTVQPGGVLCPRRYKSANPTSSPVFYHATWTFDDAARILEPVRRVVRDIRAGRVYHVPNEDCDWCVGRSPDICLPKLKAYLQPLTVVA